MLGSNHSSWQHLQSMYLLGTVLSIFHVSARLFQQPSDTPTHFYCVGGGLPLPERSNSPPRATQPTSGRPGFNLDRPAQSHSSRCGLHCPVRHHLASSLTLSAASHNTYKAQKWQFQLLFLLFVCLIGLKKKVTLQSKSSLIRPAWKT